MSVEQSPREGMSAFIDEGSQSADFLLERCGVLALAPHVCADAPLAIEVRKRYPNLTHALGAEVGNAARSDCSVEKACHAQGMDGCSNVGTVYVCVWSDAHEGVVEGPAVKVGVDVGGSPGGARASLYDENVTPTEIVRPTVSGASTARVGERDRWAWGA